MHRQQATTTKKLDIITSFITFALTSVEYYIFDLSKSNNLTLCIKLFKIHVYCLLISRSFTPRYHMI